MTNAVLEHPILRQQIVPMTVHTYQALGQMGLIEEKTELIRGFILPKMSKSPRHTTLAQRLLEWLTQILPSGFVIRQEQPITCVDSEPEPDVAIVKGSVEDFAHAHPTTATLIIEVAISTLERDREKAAIYAEAGVTQYWIVNPEQNHVEVFTHPSPKGYQHRQVLNLGETLEVPEFSGLCISISDLLR